MFLLSYLLHIWLSFFAPLLHFSRTCLEKIGSVCALFIVLWHFRHRRGSPHRGSPDRTHKSKNALRLQNIGKISPAWSFQHSFPPFALFILFSWYLWTLLYEKGQGAFIYVILPGLDHSLVVSYCSFVAGTEGLLLGIVELLEENETNGWQRLSLANGRPLRAGYTVCMVMCLSACLFWLLDRSTPKLLYVPIGPSLAYGSVICHVGMCGESATKQKGRFQNMSHAFSLLIWGYIVRLKI